MSQMFRVSWVCVLVALSGCEDLNPFLQNQEVATGGIHGRIVDANGNTVAGTRVNLDSLSGRSTVSNASGGFFLGDARDGTHAVYAYDVGLDAGAAVSVDVKNGEAFIGDLVLLDCSDVLIDPDAAGESPSAFVPCAGEGLPPPPTSSLVFGDVAIAWGEMSVEPAYVEGFLEGLDEPLSFDLYLEGSSFQSPSGGTVSTDVEDYNGTNAVIIAGVHHGGGSYYVLREGNVSLTITENQDGDPFTRDFAFTGANLVYEYTDFNVSYPELTLSVESVSYSGLAFVY